MEKANNSDRLLEIVIDLGRVPTARFVEGEIVLSEKEITRAEIDHITERIGTFDADNRARRSRSPAATARRGPRHRAARSWWGSP